jgi:hypothetical protein
LAIILAITSTSALVVASALLSPQPLPRSSTTVTAAKVLVTNDLVALAIAHFVTRHIVATTITRVVAIAITFVCMQQRGQW